MNFKSNKSKLDFKVHYNFVYMSIFVCVYIYTPFFVVFFSSQLDLGVLPRRWIISVTTSTLHQHFDYYI